ncbi:hypothetical protein RF11_16339 [Thelohanellus kitauei]|uniref:Integrase catalytic domain-containing protein n=1 Tax=Thelohanellus kitauei TaxID=669202 RepID=A0A0C2M899_THEKT|nr:hypothetical protein RF11_16339 [Thelohanellus kitauei]
MTPIVRDEVESESLALVDTGSARYLIKYNTNKSLYYTFDNFSKLLTVFGESLDHIFSISKWDIDQTNLFKPKIDTDAYKPLISPCRRSPPMFLPVAELMITEMLKAGVIGPSSGPWIATEICSTLMAVKCRVKRASYLLPMALVLATTSLVTVSFADVLWSILTVNLSSTSHNFETFIKEWPRGSQYYPSSISLFNMCKDVKWEFNKNILSKSVMIKGSLIYVNNGSQRLVIPEILCNDLVIKVIPDDLAYNLLKTRDQLMTPKSPCKPIWQDNTYTDWHVDFMCPLTVTSIRNNYVIIFADRCTKWVDTVPLPDQTALEKSHNMAYHPECNGLAERYIRAFEDEDESSYS